MARRHLNRRRFLGAAAAVATWSGAETPGFPQASVAVEVVHPTSPYATLLRHIEPGHDEFPLEKEAFRIAAELARLPDTRTLPLAPTFSGTSPLPLHYRPLAPGVAIAEFDPAPAAFPPNLERWLQSLGTITAARFFVLPEDRIRFEISSSTGYRVGHWRQKWENGQLLSFHPLEETLTTSPQPLFADITAHAFAGTPTFHQQLARGIPWWRANLDAATGIDVHGHNGIAVGDIDNSGFDAIYICQPAGLPNRLFRNRGPGPASATFEDITDLSGLGLLDATSSALFADFRNSGQQDLVILRPEGPLLFLNRGGGKFEQHPNAFRFRTAPQGSFTSMAAADYDRDGYLDLYLCSYNFFRDGAQYRYPLPYEDARNGPPNFLFRNELATTGAFVDTTTAAGLNHHNDRFSLSAAWCDYNGDGWPDLCVANDFGRKNLYRNTNGVFRDIAPEANADDPGAGMSAAWFDYDGDGLPDLYLSNMWSDSGQRTIAAKDLKPPDLWQRHPKGNTLLRNKGDGTFEDTTAQQGVEMGRWAWSSGGFDFDNDGAPEIFITTGMLTNESPTDLESFFWRRVATVSGQKEYEDGWNALSQAAHEQYSEAGHQPNVFYVRRAGRYYDFSGVSGLDVAADSRAFAVTDLTGSGTLDLILKNRLGPQVQVFRNNSATGTNSIAFTLRGTKSNRDAIGANLKLDGGLVQQAKFIEAGSGYLSQHTKTVHFGLANRTTTTKLEITWPSGLRQTFTSLTPNHRYEIEEGNPTPKATPFTQPAPIPPQPVPGDNTTTLGDITLLEPLPLPEPYTGPRILELRAANASLYAVLVRYFYDLRADLTLPAWLTLDAQNRITAVAYQQPAPPRSTPIAPALPFPGRYVTQPTRNYAALGAAFYAAGHPDAALRYLQLAPQDNARTLIAIGKIHLAAGRNPEARRHLEQGLQLDPKSAEAWNALGAVAVAEANIPQSLQHFQKALTLNPSLTTALVNAGQAQAALGRPNEAEALFRRALQADPKDPAAANQMGELLARQARDPEAKRFFQQSITARRDYAPAINNLAALFRRAGQIDDAIAAYRYGLEVAPREEAFYLNLAALYAASARADAARAVIERLLELNPASQKAHKALAELQ